jgi:hypothetical protein
MTSRSARHVATDTQTFVRVVVERFQGLYSGWRLHTPTEAERDRLAAEEFDRSRGYHLTRAERSKRAYELAEGAPVIHHGARGDSLLEV